MERSQLSERRKRVTERNLLRKRTKFYTEPVFAKLLEKLRLQPENGYLLLVLPWSSLVWGYLWMCTRSFPTPSLTKRSRRPRLTNRSPSG